MANGRKTRIISIDAPPASRHHWGGDIGRGLEGVFMATLTDIDCVNEKVPLADRTWFKLGGPAQYFAEPTSVDELQAVVQRCRDEGLQVRLLGGGSNVLVRDEGVSGMVISLTGPAFGKIAIDRQQRHGRRRRTAGQRDHRVGRRGPGRPGTAGRHSRHDRRRAARQRRHAGRRHRPMDQPRHRDDPRRRTDHRASATTWCSPIARAASTSW